MFKEASAIHRRDYNAPDYLVDSVRLDVDIRERTTVRAELALRRSASAASDAPLVLDGCELELLSLAVDGHPLAAADYHVDEDRLTIAGLPETCTVVIVTRVDPESNGALEGLYRSGPMLCTQCEAHGFSRITYYPDRPDVLSRFTVRIEADRGRYPVLLSNGEQMEVGDAGDGRHYVLWRDPHPKPCYLFALVAGDLACVEDRYRTKTGREVTLRFYVDAGNEERVPFACESLKRAMRWDEDVFGLEYDLDLYMVVAARDFNMGAMENKGLNLFNARYVLASPGTATDDDYHGVESVIAHEYFHNWTGNRVTCRDWFQLSLKEGLTVFRDQQFSADMHSADVQRIAEVRNLRTLQFPEDAGPMAHPVRPDSYVEINNFYTATVYEKGAEIVRMLQALLGREAFIAGVQGYLNEHDGSAATIEDFLAAQERVSGRSLEGFRRWYSQAGTPVVTIADDYDIERDRYTLILSQRTPPTPGQPDKLPLPIPIRFSLRDGQGRILPLEPRAPVLPRGDLILLETDHAELVFEGLGCMPVPAFLLGFSAPVQLQYGYSAAQLAFLILHESDGVARWEATQRLFLGALFELLSERPGADTEMLLKTLQALAANPPEDRALLAELLTMPSEDSLASQLQPLDGPRVAAARAELRKRIARALTGPLSVWAGVSPEERCAAAAAKRRLANLALWYLASTEAPSVLQLCARQAASPNMTVAYGALAALNDAPGDLRSAAMAAFRERGKDDALVLDKWFTLEAASASTDVARVRALLADPLYSDNPNRARAVLRTFWRQNLRAYHCPDGAGYRLLAEQVGRLDASNPQLASRLADGLMGWRGCVDPQAGRMREAIEQLAARRLSDDLREKITRALAD